MMQDWHKVHVGSAWRLIDSTLFGIPLGLLMLTAVPEAVVKAVLGIVKTSAVHPARTPGRTGC